MSHNVLASQFTTDKFVDVAAHCSAGLPDRDKLSGLEVGMCQQGN